MSERVDADSRVDQAALKTNQAFIIGFLLLAFVLNSRGLVAFVAVVMLLGTAFPRLALFQLAYRRALRPMGLIAPHFLPDDPAPHRFAQGFGGTVVLLAFAASALGLSLVAWLLVWLVIALAALNLTLGFCAGCFLYYQFRRLGLASSEEQPQ